MELRVSSIKNAEYDLQKTNNNVKVIIISSYDKDIKFILPENKLILNFEDTEIPSQNAFNLMLAKKIHDFINTIDFNKYKLYICCDSGESRSAAVACAILRKYKENENMIWKDYNYHPNILVYDILCKEFGLRNSKLRLKYKKYINKKALRDKINKSRIKNKKSS